VATTLGADAKTHAASLSNLCASVFGPDDALDKTEQTSRWDARPLRASQILYAALDALAPRVVLCALLEKRAHGMFEGDVVRACVPWTKTHALGPAGKTSIAPPPRTDADVRAALTRLGALFETRDAYDRSTDASAEHDPDRLVMVEGWAESSLKKTTLLCKTLAVVAERAESDGKKKLELAATCVLPACDSVRLDLASAAEALGVDVSSPTVRLRLANAFELRGLFGFTAGSVGPFGLRDCAAPLKRATVMDASLFVCDDEKHVFFKNNNSPVVAVGGGAPDVKVVGTARAVAKHADASVARLTARNRDEPPRGEVI